MSDLGTEKEMYKHQVIYEMCGDKVFFVIPQNDHYSERRLVMTKDLFIACYEHWIKKVEHDGILTEGKTGRNLKADTPTLFECSVCGWSCWDTLPGDSEYNYCPNCGARMVE